MKNHLTNLLLGVVALLLAVDVSARLRTMPARGPEDRIADALERIANQGIKVDDDSEIAVKGTFSDFRPIKVQQVK